MDFVHEYISIHLSLFHHAYLHYLITFSNLECILIHGGRGLIVPIQRAGGIDDAKNYRGSTLIHMISNLYSHILLNRLTKWSIQHNQIIDNQFGFQKKKSTVDCVFLIRSIITKTCITETIILCIYRL